MQHIEHNNLQPLSSTKSLKRWITDGVAQGENGAFHAWYDVSSETLSYPYPEITGYALTYLSHSSASLSIAMRAADWLVDRLAFNRLAAREQDGEAVYNFDLAMIATGLISLGRKIERDKYIAAGLYLVNFLQEQIILRDLIQPLSQAHSPSPRQSTWSTEGRAHLLKIVQCLLLAQEEGMFWASESAKRLIRSTSNLQLENGRFITHPADTETFLHPHLYAAEGLWMWGTARDDNEALEQARKAVIWAWTYQLDTGGFPHKVDNEHNRVSGVEQSDVTAQAVRLALLLKLPFPGLDQALIRLLQAAHGDEKWKALLYRPASTDLHQNTWATIFAAQALEIATIESQTFTWRHLA